MEYLDAGLPVIASRVGGNPELVSDGQNGFLYEVGDVEALAECINKIARDSEIRKLFAENSIEVVRRLDCMTMVEHHESEYAIA
jgi:glycosyltransferase involved in cell wall biosynthesis